MSSIMVWIAAMCKRLMWDAVCAATTVNFVKSMTIICKLLAYSIKAMLDKVSYQS